MAYKRGGRERVAELKYKAFELRKSGKTFKEIAETFNIPVTTAYDYVQQYAQQFQPQSNAVLLEIELGRLDRMYLMLQDKMNQGDVAAIREGREIIEQKIATLGLAVPKRHILSGPDGAPVLVREVIFVSSDGQEE